MAIATLLWLTLDASDQRRQGAERAEARTAAAVQCVAALLLVHPDVRDTDAVERLCGAEIAEGVRERMSIPR